MGQFPGGQHVEAEPGRMGGNLSLTVPGKALPAGGTACAEAGAEKRRARGLSLLGARASSRGMGRRGGACDETFTGEGVGGRLEALDGGGQGGLPWRREGWREGVCADPHGGGI